MPKISVIVPVYNVEKYLNRCVDSILAQTFTDFECILVDDGSTDSSGKICDEYAEKDSRIKVFHQENKGQAAARNFALDIAAGDYIGFVDSDDYIHPKMYEILLDNLLKTDADVCVCGYYEGGKCDYKFSDDDISGKCETFGGSEFLKRGFIEKRGGDCWLLWSKLYKRSCFDGIRMPEGRIYEDNAVVYKILYNCKKIADCAESKLYYYFVRENSTVNSDFSLKKLDWLTVVEEMILFFDKNKEDELLNRANKCYLYELHRFCKTAKEHHVDQDVQNTLRKKLKAQYDREKTKYPINFKTYPSVMNELFPFRAACYWRVKAVESKLRR